MVLKRLQPLQGGQLTVERAQREPATALTQWPETWSVRRAVPLLLEPCALLGKGGIQHSQGQEREGRTSEICFAGMGQEAFQGAANVRHPGKTPRVGLGLPLSTARFRVVMQV